MVPARGLGFVAAIVFALCIWTLVWLVFIPRAGAQELHPWRGYALLCVAPPGQQVQCEQIQTRQAFETQTQCESQVPRLLQELADAIHRDHGDWDVNVQYACRPDTRLNNV